MPKGSLPSLVEVKPERVGFSSARLQRLDAALQRLVDDGEFAGITVLAARRGRVFHAGNFGLRDLAAGAPVRSDTIFRIHSMTKPVTGVAMMLLYEEGLWKPDDPIAAYIPEFRNLPVFRTTDARGVVLTEAPAHSPTMRELMTHTAGFSYGVAENAADAPYRDKSGGHQVLEAPSLAEMIARLARIPLTYQPGTRWAYSVSVDIQGYLVEMLSGMALPEFFEQRIFRPLGMKDTAFHVPSANRGRLAGLYKKDPGKPLEPASERIAGLRGYDRPPDLPSGGGGLVSTAEDYMRFCRMLLNGGQLGRVRLLSPTTVKLMSTNHVAPAALAVDQGGGILPPGFGFGYDFAVITDPGLAATAQGQGTYYWAGAAGCWFWIDPANEIAFVGMVQRTDSPERPNLFTTSAQLLYQALLC